MMMNNFVFLITKNSEFENAFHNKKRPFLNGLFCCNNHYLLSILFLL